MNALTCRSPAGRPRGWAGTTTPTRSGGSPRPSPGSSAPGASWPARRYWCIGWIILNTIGIVKHWDPYPFILLNLAFSTQAAYAAPLILLAQNRQDDRDRANIDRDREVAARTQADTEFLARELAAVRLALADVVTTEDLDDWLARMAKLIADGRPPPESPTTPRSLASSESLTAPDSRPGQNHIER